MCLLCFILAAAKHLEFSLDKSITFDCQNSNWLRYSVSWVIRRLVALFNTLSYCNWQVVRTCINEKHGTFCSVYSHKLQKWANQVNYHIYYSIYLSFPLWQKCSKFIFLSILRHGHVINNVNIWLMLKILKKNPIILKITIVVAMLCSRPLEFIILIKLVIWPRSSLFLTMPTSSPCRDELRFQSLFLCSSCFIPHGHPLGSSIFQMSEFSALDTEECPTV